MKEELSAAEYEAIRRHADDVSTELLIRTPFIKYNEKNSRVEIMLFDPFDDVFADRLAQSLGRKGYLFDVWKGRKSLICVAKRELDPDD